MALGSWQGLYNSVIDDLMDQQREQELLLLMAIARFADPLGFAFPGRGRLEERRRVGPQKHLQRENWLIQAGLLAVENVYNPRRRRVEPHYQISPYALYVRDEFLPYCEAVFTSQQDRDFDHEDRVLLPLLREKEGQPESLPESEPEPEPDAVPKPKTRESNQTAPSTEKGKGKASTMRKNQPPAGHQPPARQNRKDNPQAGGPADDEFSALLSPTVDDQRMVQEICHIASTTPHQAASLVRVYPREAIVHWLRICAQRRQRGELSNPGGWFFKTLQSQTPLPIEHWPLWAQQQAAKTDDIDLSDEQF